MFCGAKEVGGVYRPRCPSRTCGIAILQTGRAPLPRVQGGVRATLPGAVGLPWPAVALAKADHRLHRAAPDRRDREDPPSLRIVGGELGPRSASGGPAGRRLNRSRRRQPSGPRPALRQGPLLYPCVVSPRRGQGLPTPLRAFATPGRARYRLRLPVGRKPKAVADVSGPNSSRFHLEQPPPFGHAPITRKSKFL
jgi:hypothetical protein